MSTTPQQAKYKLTDAVDFLIVGCGASGSVLARELSRNGFSVVALEQGPWLDRSQFTHDEYRVQAQHLLTNNPQKQPMTFRKTPNDKAVKQPALVYGRLVGGGTVHFTANYWRFHEIDFIEASKKGDDRRNRLRRLAHHLLRYGAVLHQSGMGPGRFGTGGCESVRSARSKPYPLPPMPVKSSGVIFEQAARKLGYHPFPAPMAVISQSYQGRPGLCTLRILHGIWMRNGSQVESAAEHDSTGDRHGTVRDPAAQLRAKRELDAKGRAIGAIYFNQNGEENLQRAKAVIVSGNGAETARLLLLSKSNHFPDGLANSSGVVGKYLMFNTDPLCGATFEHELNEYKSIQVTRILHDFYEIDPKLGFYGGGGLDARFLWTPISFGFVGLSPHQPQWGSQYKKALARNFNRTIFIAAHTTSLPVENNGISLDDTVKDAWGLPAMSVTYKDHPDDLKTGQFLLDRSMEIPEASGAQDRWAFPVEESEFGFHLLGTCRMGSDPKSSVINSDHRTHDVANLFLCDGSSFVTSGRGQATETIQALAFRASDRITGLAKKGEI